MDALELGPLRRYLLEQELMFLAGQPATYHCHHYNLFLDQTIDDALGVADATRLKTRAAREATYPLIANACEHVGASTPAERTQVATELFRLMGHGRLDVLAGHDQGSAKGAFLHYSHSWNEKYGASVRRRHPADAFASGFICAASEVAEGLPCGTLWATEERCAALKEPNCSFELTRDPEPEAARIHVGEAETQSVVGPAGDGVGEDVIQPIVAGLKAFTATVSGDARGLIPAFGVFAAMQMTGYYNRISYDAVEEVARRSPASVPVLESLLRESGHVCVYHTFGGVLLSPEWESLVGPPQGSPQDIVVWCMAIARGFGFGRWQLAEFEENRRLVLRTSSSYESVYYRTRHGLAQRPVEYLWQGAAVATAQLAHSVSWKDNPTLNAESYQELFKRGIKWKAEQTQAITAGDPVSEIVVTRV